MFAYNEAALSSYREFGVGQVIALDGDQDAECAARNGQTFSVDDAFSIADHPNGTLDWAPVVKAVIEPVVADPLTTQLVEALKATLVGRSHPVSVNVIGTEVRQTRTVIDRDENGRIIGSHEEPDDAA